MIEASVIISTYNRIDHLRRCLEALEHQTYAPSDFEVVVVIDGSTDLTRQFLDSYQPNYPLQVIWQPNSGQSVAFNNAIRIANGKIFIFLDDDIRPVSSFVEEHLRVHHEQDRVVGIGQLTLNIPPRADWFTKRFAEDWRKHYIQLNEGKVLPNWQDCYCGNMSVSRTAFQEIEGFSVLPRGNDIEIGYRLSQQGFTFVYIPGACGDQDQQKGGSALLKDAERSGAGCMEIYRRHPQTLLSLFGRFNEQRLRMSALLRLLLKIDLPPQHLQGFGWLVEKITGSDFGFHLLHRYAYWRGVHHTSEGREYWSGFVGGIPILMYHAFCESEEPASRFIMPIHRFNQQMAWLKRRGYHVLSMGELSCYRKQNQLPPERSIVISLDDGYADSWQLAYPVLRRYGFSATIFLVSDRVSGANTWDSQGELSGRPLLSWANAQEMCAGGMEFGAHGSTHCDLCEVPLEIAKKEIISSKDRIQTELNITVEAFSYPFGKYNSTIAAMVEQSGFTASCGIENGLNILSSPIHALRRVEIYGTDSMIRFALAVHFGARTQVLLQQLVQLINSTRSLMLSHS